MIRLAACWALTLTLMTVAQSAHAQWVTQWHAPMVVAPQPVLVAHPPVVRVHRAPMVVYHPRRVYARHRPILGEIGRAHV